MTRGHKSDVGKGEDTGAGLLLLAALGILTSILLAACSAYFCGAFGNSDVRSPSCCPPCLTPP
jgi:hypothetical protein